MGIDTGACVEPGKIGPLLASPVELTAKIERLVHFGRSIANSDGKHEANACLLCADKHRFAIGGVALAVQVCVGIDQQFCLAGRTGRVSGNRPV